MGLLLWLGKSSWESRRPKLIHAGLRDWRQGGQYSRRNNRPNPPSDTCTIWSSRPVLLTWTDPAIGHKDNFPSSWSVTHLDV